MIYEGKTKGYRPQEFTWINKPVVVTPNDTVAHYGPSLPIDINLLVNTIVNGGGSLRIRQALRDQA